MILTDSMARHGVLILILTSAAGLAACSPGVDSTQSQDEPPILSAENGTVTAGRYAQVVYLDPNTGELTDTPPPGVTPPTSTLNVRLEPAEIIPELQADGSTAVFFGDALQQNLVATVGCDGKVSVTHASAAAVDKLSTSTTDPMIDFSTTCVSGDGGQP